MYQVSYIEYYYIKDAEVICKVLLDFKVYNAKSNRLKKQKNNKLLISVVDGFCVCAKYLTKSAKFVPMLYLKIK